MCSGFKRVRAETRGLVFSSPWQKTKVSFSDRPSVFRQFVKIIKCLSSSPVPLGQYRSTLAQVFLGNQDSNEGPRPFFNAQGGYGYF